MKRIALTLLIVLAVSACAKTGALEDIHKTYRREFVQFALPAPSGTPGLTPDDDAIHSFAETLRGIREYRTRYGTGGANEAHLTVLEGMIYLQSGRLGMALLLKDSVAAAAVRLKSGHGGETRDRLLALAFPDLIKGWREINEELTRDTINNAEFAVLESSADSIAALLSPLAEADSLRVPDTDEGAIYLATTAAIFLTYTYTLRCDDEPANRPENQELLQKGHELIGLFLSETEKTAAGGEPGRGPAAGRIRYLDWYASLGQWASRETPC